VRDRPADDKAARLDARDLVDFRAGPGLHQFVHGAPEGARIAQKSGDIAEHDPRLGIVLNGADRILEIVLELDADHEIFTWSAPRGTAEAGNLANTGVLRNNQSIRCANGGPRMISQAPSVAIIGGGPAGMSCALWLCNYGLQPIIVERDVVLGGMARRSPYPNEWLLGRPGETARENAYAFERHLRQLSATVCLGARPRQLRREGDGRFRLDPILCGAHSSGLPAAHPFSTATLVIATGTRYQGEEWLDRVHNARLMAAQGRVHVGAPWAGEPDADFGSHVAVIGGGDNAFDVARMLAERGVRVTIVMRSSAPRAQPLIVQRLLKHRGMTQVLSRRSVRAVEDCDPRLRLQLDDGDCIEVDHVILLLGYRPNSDESWMLDLALKQDARGYFVVDGNMETSCPGVFAVGDVANSLHPCIVSAVASGAAAAREIAKRLGWAPA